MMHTYEAMVSLKSGTQLNGSHMQKVSVQAVNAYDARCALEAMYGRVMTGPSQVIEHRGSYWDNW